MCRRGLEEGALRNDTAVESAERDALVRKIHRAIKVLERHKRPANRRESYHLVVALRFLRDGQYDAGQAAMTDVERRAPIPPEAANRLETNAPVPVHQLRAGLQAILAGRA